MGFCSMKRFVFAVLIMFWGITCSRTAIQPDRILKIARTQDAIVISGEQYQLSISTSDGFAELRNKDWALLASFPLHAQFDPGLNPPSPIQLDWQIKGKEVHLKTEVDGYPYQRVTIRPSSDAFEVIFGIRPTPQDSGVYLFQRGSSVFQIPGLESTFSPEPDDFDTNTPQVDVRVARDEKWVFSPAPLNLSFITKQGNFSLGLAELPDASLFVFRHGAIYLDYPWYKIPPSSDIHMNLVPIVFTFNRSSWEAVGDYQAYLVNHHYIPSDERRIQKRALWWSRAMVCTRGEQMTRNIPSDHPDYTAEWVKNYIIDQQTTLNNRDFTVLIDEKWCQAYGDPNPSERFRDLRTLVDWCHERGHKVVLSWYAWKIENTSLAADFNVADGEFIDATHPQFEAYIDSCCRILFGSGEGQLNVDGLKVDHLYDVRDPSSANYRNPADGIGIKELYHYLKTLYVHAKKVKADGLIIGNAIDPHFASVQDMVSINEDWDSKLRREKRARIIHEAMPDLLICGDAVQMYNSIALYHYVTSAIYAVPTIYYLWQFQDGDISEMNRHIINHILELNAHKPVGRLEFVDYGNWRILHNGYVLAESLPQGKGIAFYTDESKGMLLCAENTSLHMALTDHRLRSIFDEQGNSIPFKDLGQEIYELRNLKQGELYRLSLGKDRKSF